MLVAWNVLAWSWSLSFCDSSPTLTWWLYNVGIYQCLLVLPFHSALSNLGMGDRSPLFYDLCLFLILHPLTSNYPHHKRLILLYWQDQGFMKSKVKLPLTSAGAKVNQLNQRTWGEKQNRKQRVNSTYGKFQNDLPKSSNLPRYSCNIQDDIAALRTEAVIATAPSINTDYLIITLPSNLECVGTGLVSHWLQYNFIFSDWYSLVAARISFQSHNFWNVAHFIKMTNAGIWWDVVLIASSSEITAGSRRTIQKPATLGWIGLLP